MIRRLILAAAALIGLAAPAAAQSIPVACSQPNFTGGVFHPGCLAAADLNNSNTYIIGQITASGALHLSLTGGTLTGALAGTSATFLTGTFTGTLTGPTVAVGTNSNAVATTNFVATSFAPKADPAFTGTPTAPTAAPGTSTAQIATTAFVTGYVVAGFAPIDSPAFSGTPTAPTAAPGTNTTQLATTAFVAGAGYAPLASPGLTGVPTAPTADPGTDTDQIATTAFVLANGGGGGGGAPLNSPHFTGIPTAPTASVGTNTTQLATMAALQAAAPQLSAGTLLANPGASAAVGSSTAIGGPPGRGVHLSSAYGLTGPPETTLYLSAAPDASGIATYLTASRAASGLSETALSATLTGTGPFTVANFVTAPGDPGANAYPPGVPVHQLYATVSDGAGVASIVVETRKREGDGTETVLATSLPSTLNGTAPAVLPVYSNVTAGAAMGVTDRLVFKVIASRVSGPTSFAVNLYVDGTTNRSTASTTGSGDGTIGPDYVLNVIDLGAKRDAIAQADGVITSGTNRLCSASANFGPADAGKTIEVNDMLGLGGTPFLGTITAWVSTSCVDLSGNATASTNGTSYNIGADVEVGGTTGNYAVGDTVCIAGGTYTVQGCFAVAAVAVAPNTATTPALTVVNPGTGGVDGATFLRGTTGSGMRFIASAVFSGGALVSVDLFNGGLYTVAPSNLASEPVTADNGATGIILAIARLDARQVDSSVTGSYTVTPTDPTATDCATPSGACGATLDVTYAKAGRFVYFSNDNAAFTRAINQANALQTAGKRSIIRIPSGNYGITGTGLPVMTKPVMLLGDGRSQTQITVTQGYTGAHIFGYAPGLGASGVISPAGPTTIFSANPLGAGAQGISLFGNRNATNIPDGFVVYDLAGGMLFNGISGNDIGSLIHTGAILNSSGAYLRESLINDYRCTSCGTAGTGPIPGRPAMWFDAVGLNAKTNNLQVNNGNIVFPFGPGFALTSHGYQVSSSKAMIMDYLRVERGQKQQGVAGVGDLVMIGSPGDTDDIAGVFIGQLWLVAVQQGGSGLGIYGTSRASRPSNISVGAVGIHGSSLGTGINVQAGYNVYIGIENGFGASGHLVTGTRTDNRLNSSADTGSTTSAVVLLNGSATNSKYNGGALVAQIPAKFTASLNTGGVLTVTAMDGVTPGRLVPGAVLAGSGVKGGQKIVAQLTGTTGGVGTYSVLNPPTLALGSRAMTTSFTEARTIVGYVGSTRTATVAALQGSSASFTYTPVVGESMVVDSLIEPVLTVNDFDNTLDWSGVTPSVAAILSSPLRTTGIPTGERTVPQKLYLAGGLRLAPGTVPSTPTDTCSTGTASYDASYFYLCTGTNAWKRAPISAWPSATPPGVYGIIATTTVDLNAATSGAGSDQAITLPAGRYLLGSTATTASLQVASLTKCSGLGSTASGGIYTATAKGGSVVSTNAAFTSLNNTANSAWRLAGATSSAQSAYTNTTLYFSLSVAQGTPVTCQLDLWGTYIP
jgi:hypothetical protein